MKFSYVDDVASWVTQQHMIFVTKRVVAKTAVDFCFVDKDRHSYTFLNHSWKALAELAVWKINLHLMNFSQQFFIMTLFCYQFMIKKLVIMNNSIDLPRNPLVFFHDFWWKTCTEVVTVLISINAALHVCYAENPLKNSL